MSRSLDVIAFTALDAESNLLRVTNDDMRSFVQERLASELRPEQVLLYEKLLSADRSRYIAAGSLAETFDEGHSARYARYRERTVNLARACLKQLQASYDFESRQVRALVTNTTVGGMVPNLSSVMGRELGLEPSASVIDLGYMGCATALLALDLIEQQLRPGELGIVLSSEITSAMINMAAESDASLVANTVFGDGVGMFLVARRPHRHKAWLRILGHAGSVLTDDEALSAISYEPNAVYHEIRLNTTIASVAARGLQPVVESLVRSHLLRLPDLVGHVVARRKPKWQRNLAHAVLHTAGTKILEGVTSALQLAPEQVAHNFEAFRLHGNTSSASIYYSLDHLARTPGALKSGDKVLFLGYGSGFLTRGAVVQVV